jgi:hypothetical protein
MTMLDERLRALGDTLDLIPDDDLVDTVLARLDEPPSRDGRSLLRIAAALVLVLALVAVAVPSSRRSVADWFGFDGLRIERRPGTPTASVPDPLDRDGAGDDDPSHDVSDPTNPPASIGTVVDVEGADILVSEFVGTLDNPAIGKTVGDGTNVRQVEVGGELGLWIDGAPHEVSFFDADRDIVFERFAGNTLLWQDGSVIRRLEGFVDVGAAIEFAERIGT